MKKIRYALKAVRGERLLRQLLLLSLFFCVGILLGQGMGTRAADDAELYRYLNDFFKVNAENEGATLLSALLLYFRYPLLAFLLGFASIGVVLLPLLTVAFGFFLAFSVACFASVFGAEGILLAFSLFGIRVLLTLPCYFLLAVPAFRNSISLAMLSFGNGKRVAPVLYGPAYFLRFFLCAAVLAAGALSELSLSPLLLRLVCTRIFTG